jgi:hypothetical protein
MRGTPRNEATLQAKMSHDLIHRDLTEAIIGVFFNVHWELGLDSSSRCMRMECGSSFRMLGSASSASNR